MKTMKRVAALLLCMCLLIGLPISVGAADVDTITIESAIYQGFANDSVTVRLTFSCKVQVKKDTFMLRNDRNTNGCTAETWQYWESQPTAVDGVEVKNQTTYAKVWDVTFTLCVCDKCKPKVENGLWDNGLPDGTVIRINDNKKSDATTDRAHLSSQTIVGINGELLPTTIEREKYDEFFMDVTVAEEPLTEVVSAVILDANDATKVQMLTTFSRPVTVNCPQKDWGVVMRFHDGLISGTGAKENKQMVGYEYQSGVVGADGKTYSDQILFTFAKPAQVPLMDGVGITFDEASFRDDWSDGEVSASVIADEWGRGLTATKENANGRAVSYTLATLAEDAQKIVSISRASDTQICVNFAMVVSKIDVTKNITIGDCVVTAVEGSGAAWVLTVDHAMSGDDAILTVPANAVTTGYNKTVVAKAMTAMLSLSDCLAAATAGDTIKLYADEEMAVVTVPAGVALDLNGFELTAETVSSFGNVIDSKDGQGGIKIAKNEADNNLILTASNGMLPLYDEEFEGYRFFNCTLEHKGREKGDDYQFGYMLKMSDVAFALLVNNDADIALEYDITIQVDDKEPVTLLRKFSAEILKEYAEKQLLDDGHTYAAVLRITGFDQVTTQVVTLTSSNPKVVSGTGVVIAAADATVTYTYSNTQ